MRGVEADTVLQISGRAMLGPSDGKQQLHSHLCLQSCSARVQREGPAVALGCSLSLEPAGITLPRYCISFT